MIVNDINILILFFLVNIIDGDNNYTLHYWYRASLSVTTASIPCYVPMFLPFPSKYKIKNLVITPSAAHSQ